MGYCDTGQVQEAINSCNYINNQGICNWWSIFMIIFVVDITVWDLTAGVVCIDSMQFELSGERYDRLWLVLEGFNIFGKAFHIVFVVSLFFVIGGRIIVVQLCCILDKTMGCPISMGRVVYWTTQVYWTTPLLELSTLWGEWFWCHLMR